MGLLYLFYFYHYAVLIFRLRLPVVLYGCETWLLTLREERRLKVFENRVLRRMFGPKRDEVTGEWKKLYNEELNDLYSLPNIVRVVNREEWDGRGMWCIWGRGEVCTGFWWGNLKEENHWGDPDVDGRITLRRTFRKWEGVVGTGWRVGSG